MTFFRKIFSPLRYDHRGTLLFFIVIFGSMASTILVSGVASYAILEHRASTHYKTRELSFHIAEAGIAYYRWHLAHNPTDYTDGTGHAGPYVHTFTDKNGVVIGNYALTVTPPLAGSSVVTIRAVGTAVRDPSVHRTLQVRVGFPSLSDNTFLSNADMSFSATTIVHGSVRANGGIRFDGTTDAWVQSAKNTYQYQSQTKNGVWGAGGPTSFWKFPVPATDFYAVTADLSTIRTASLNGGLHLNSSGQEGWHIVFTSTTYNLYRVTSRACYNGQGQWLYGYSGWYWNGTTYCYDIGAQTFVSSGQIPANGAIFVEDDVWVDGLVNARVSLAVGRFPVQTPYKKIYINNNLLYAARATTNVVGLMAQGDIVVPYNVPNTMEIDAAILSQFGSIGRPYYDANTRTNLTVFGSQISYVAGGWKYVNGSGTVLSGFINTNHVYDGNLRYYPPPGFPVGNVYELLSWEELQV